jgi:hypothetical protein
VDYLASIFFKNNIRRRWKPTAAEQASLAINDQDRQTIKGKLLQAIALTPSNIRYTKITTTAFTSLLVLAPNWSTASVRC